jgi:signal transduction histidine kinase
MHLDGEVPLVTTEVSGWLPQMERVLNYLSHDLKNPLSIVRGNAQLAMMINKEEKVQTCLQRVIQAVDNMTEILNEVRCLRKAPDNSKEPVMLNTLLMSILQAEQPTILSSGIAVSYRLKDNVEVIGNTVLLTSAIKHLIKNALEAMPNGGELITELHVHDSKAYLAISDTGLGIPLELQPKVFKEFFSTKTGGCGWGLIIADQVIRISHSGALQFISSDHGTTFTVTLPL